MLTKEECEKALMNICSSNAKMDDRKVFYQLINEHFELFAENEMLKRTVEILDQEGVDKCNKLEAQAKKIKRLEKALDNACQELEDYCDTYECYVSLQKEPHHKDEWKEWLLKG